MTNITNSTYDIKDEDSRPPMLSKAPSMRKSSTTSLVPGGVKKAPAAATGGGTYSTYSGVIYLGGSDSDSGSD
jgi:hypothetical protein